MRLPVAALSLLVWVGCPTTDDDDFATDDDEATPRRGSLDTSGLADGRVSLPYSGRVAVIDYDGPALFISETLPEGLRMTPGGSVFGTPTRFGSFDVRVVVSEMEGVQDLSWPIALRILPAEATAPFLGIEHPHLNNLWRDHRLLRDPWVRVAGGGSADAQVFVLRPGIYEGGPDGEATGGLGDDALIATLELDEIDVEMGEFVYTPAADARPPSYPSGHYNEWDPVVYDPVLGTLTAGTDTGVAEVRITNRQYGELLLRVAVVAPDWCPQGTEDLCE